MADVEKTWHLNQEYHKGVGGQIGVGVLTTFANVSDLFSASFLLRPVAEKGQNSRELFLVHRLPCSSPTPVANL